MNTPVEKDSLFKVVVTRNPKALKILFYLTSYAFPWWAYKVPIERFKKLGYEVVVYDFDDTVIENTDPTVLPTTVELLTKEIHERCEHYVKKGITTFHGIGNSLGSYMIYNYALRYPIDAIVLNSGGSVADIIFGGKGGTWAKIAASYELQGVNQQKLKFLWADSDDPKLGKNIKAKRILLQYSLKDGTIPLQSTLKFVDSLKASGKSLTLEINNLPHIRSVLKNSHQVKHIYRFLNSIV